jgi:chromosome segregation ATPase
MSCGWRISVVARSQGKTGPGSGGPADWIDQEIREAKARLHKIENELAQALKHTYGLEGEMRKLLETMTVAGSIENAVGAVREEVRQLREQMSRLHDRQGAVQTRVDQVLTQRQQESGRDRNEIAAAVKQVEAIQRVLEQSDARVKVVEEASRRIEDELAAVRLTLGSFDRAFDELTQRVTRTHDVAMRVDQDHARVAGDIARLEKSDDSLTERVAAYTEQLHRAFERIDRLEGLATFSDEVREQLQRATNEREQLAGKIAGVEQTVGQLVETGTEVTITLAKLDQRGQNTQTEVLGQAALLADLTDDTKTAMKKIYQMLLRQRRRRSEALNQEIKELTAGEIHASD